MSEPISIRAAIEEALWAACAHEDVDHKRADPGSLSWIDGSFSLERFIAAFAAKLQETHVIIPIDLLRDTPMTVRPGPARADEPDDSASLRRAMELLTLLSAAKSRAGG